MNSTASINIIPQHYSPSFESLEKDEQKTIDELLEVFSEIREKTYADTGHALRSVHAKSHALLNGEIRVHDNLPAYLAQGMFYKPALYPVVMRLSASPGDLLPDSVSTPRGCAIKIMGVDGERLPGSEKDNCQDFVMINGGPVFQVADLSSFVSGLRLLEKTTDKAEGLKVAFSTLVRGVEKVIESFGGSSAVLKNLGGEPSNHILGESFFSQVPVLFGSYMAKFSLVPVSPELTALTGKPLDVHDDANALRRSVISFFAKYSGVWELRVQLCTDIEKMPLENASVNWPEALSPYVTVASITLPMQPAWNEDLSVKIDDQMSFSPWNGIGAHRPLGSIMRARKPAYAQSAQFRAFHQDKNTVQASTACPFKG